MNLNNGWKLVYVIVKKPLEKTFVMVNEKN